MQLGAVIVSVGDGVAEGETVGTIAVPGEPTAIPHVQLGTRRADDPRGYVDPLTLLPPRPPAPSPADHADAFDAGSAVYPGGRRAHAGRVIAGKRGRAPNGTCRSGACGSGTTGVGKTRMLSGHAHR